jgi:hypothetical protein
MLIEVIEDPRKPFVEMVRSEFGNVTVVIAFPLVVPQFPPIADANPQSAIVVTPSGTTTVPTHLFVPTTELLNIKKYPLVPQVS